MKPIEEIRELTISACQKAQDDGWEFMTTSFMNKVDKRCCPVMAIAMFSGYDASTYTEYEESNWIKLVKEAIGQGEEETSYLRKIPSWNYIWQGYDGTATDNEEFELYKLGQEIRQLFPAYHEK